VVAPEVVPVVAVPVMATDVPTVGLAAVAPPAAVAAPVAAVLAVGTPVAATPVPIGVAAACVVGAVAVAMEPPGPVVVGVRFVPRHADRISDALRTYANGS